MKMKAHIKATLANGTFLQWILNTGTDATFGTLQNFIEACTINEPKIVHFTITINMPVIKDK